MKITKPGLLPLMLITIMLTSVISNTASAQDKNRVIRVAKLQIDSAQLQTYKAALEEEIETSVHVEPGVLTLYAVAEKGNPTHITIFEIYANQDAYLAHLQTPHFIKYKAETKDMVKSLELMETDPVILRSKGK